MGKRQKLLLLNITIITFLCFNHPFATAQGHRSSEVEYSVINTEILSGSKRKIEVRLNQKISKKKLSRLAEEIRGDAKKKPICQIAEGINNDI